MYHAQENISRDVEIRLWIIRYSAIQSVWRSNCISPTALLQRDRRRGQSDGSRDAWFVKFVVGSRRCFRRFMQGPAVGDCARSRDGPTRRDEFIGIVIFV